MLLQCHPITSGGNSVKKSLPCNSSETERIVWCLITVEPPNRGADPTIALDKLAGEINLHWISATYSQKHTINPSFLLCNQQPFLIIVLSFKLFLSTPAIEIRIWTIRFLTCFCHRIINSRNKVQMFTKFLDVHFKKKKQFKNNERLYNFLNITV